MLRKILIGLTASLVLAAAWLLAITPPKLENRAVAPAVSGQLDLWLDTSEKQVDRTDKIIPGTEKRIIWHQGRANHKTDWSLVYLHGFSASRQELAPVPQRIAEGLSANLFETRLAGHGIKRGALESVAAEEWLDDAAEALTIGAQIGERVAVIGTSTGATLLLAMAAHPLFEPVQRIVLISPNFAPSDPKSEFLTWPGGLQLAHLLVGKRRHWQPVNDVQARYWIHDYPMSAALEVMRLVKFTRAQLPLKIDQALLTFYSPDDKVVNPAAILEALESIESPTRQLLSLPGSSNSSNHVLAGDVLAPQNNSFVVESVIHFVLDE
jgi:esterase/lipase